MTGRRHTHTLPTLLSVAALVAAGVGVLLAPLVPVYLDEIGWRMITGRYLLDGGVTISLFPRCGASFATVPPAFMVPVRLVEAGVHEAGGLLGVRLAGMAAALLWAVVVAVLLPRAVGRAPPPLHALGAVAAAVGLGAMPLLLILNRPEQILLVGLTLFLLVPLVLPAERSRWVDAALAIGVVVVTLAMLASHPKALLFLPLVVVSLFLAVRPWVMRAALIAVVAYAAVESYGFWAAFGGCPDDPAFGRYLAGQMVQVGDLLSRPAETVGLLAANLGRSVLYGKALQAGGVGVLPWLMPGPAVPSVLLMAVNLLIGAAAAAGLAVGAVAVGVGLGARRLEPRLMLVLALAVSAAGLAATQTAKNFYELALLGPLAVLAVLIALPFVQHRFARAGRAALVLLCSAAVVSQSVLWFDLLVLRGVDYLQGGYAPALHNAHSVSPYRADAWQERIRGTAQRCGIDPDRPPPRLVVDTLTYPALSGGATPYHMFFVVAGPRSPVAGLTGRELAEFLAAKDASGVVAGCRLIPPDMPGVVRDGELCCVAPTSFTSLER